jgi:hypothetical protein
VFPALTSHMSATEASLIVAFVSGGDAEPRQRSDRTEVETGQALAQYEDRPLALPLPMFEFRRSPEDQRQGPVTHRQVHVPGLSSPGGPSASTWCPSAPRRRHPYVGTGGPEEASEEGDDAHVDETLGLGPARTMPTPYG